MSQQVQELIDKIKTEGIQQADQKAKEIEDRAHAAAKKIVEDAQAKAERILADAQTQAEKTKTSSEMALKQSARDTLLALRKEIGATLRKVIAKEVKGALSREELVHILEEVIKGIVSGNLTDQKVEIALNEGDLKKLKEGFTAKLQKEIKQPLIFKTNEGISAGFTISFDEGKSCFDFSDESLVEYLSSYLNDQVAALLNG